MSETTQEQIEKLKERRHRLMHKFGYSAWRDGLVQDRIDAIDRKIAALTYGAHVAPALAERKDSPNV